jgi:hypothetical protein
MVQLIILHQLGNLPGIAEPNSAYLQLFALWDRTVLQNWSWLYSTSPRNVCCSSGPR